MIRTVRAKRLSRKEIEIRRIKNTSPIFIIGSQRSGTTFLYRLIQNYLRIGFGRDNGNFIRLMNLLPYYGNLKEKENLQKLMKDILAIPEFKKRFRGLKINIDEFIENLEKKNYPEVVRRFYAEWAHFKNSIRWGGKTPDYSLHAPQLHSLFPDAKFIHIIRDGRDVALSLNNLNWGPKDSFIAAKHWKERVNQALYFGRTLNDKLYMEMRYENLVRDPVMEFERLIHFIDYEGDKESIIRQFENEISNKVKKGNYFKWKKKMSPRQVKAFELMAGDLLAELGYEIVYPHEIKKKIRIWHYVWHHGENAIRKLLRGEGFKGIYRRLYRFVYDSWIKLSYQFTN